ncbi:MAG: ETC complex I subunit [Terricaulis sp.]
MLAKIYQPAKSAMQSGAGKNRWRLEFAPGAPPRSDALMGWTSSLAPSGQARLSFDTKEQAIAFARTHQIPHQVSEPQARTRITKAYADNFAFRKREPWSH